MSAQPSTQVRATNRISKVRIQEAVTTALREAINDNKSGAKFLGDTSGASHRTAQKWLQGLGLPSFEHWANLEDAIPGLRSRYRQLAQMRDEMDPDLERTIEETQRIIMQFHATISSRKTS